jgi:CheY-like chemotaxis protein
MIMIVVEDPNDREQLSHFLRERGYEVGVPPHRQDVLAMVRDTPPQVIILDLYVADPRGIEVLKQVREQGYTGKVIAIAGESMRSVLPEVAHLGIDQVIGGPGGRGESLSLDQVEAVILTLLHQQISKRAYALYEQRGREEGRAWEDWFEAKRQILTPHSGSTEALAQ